MKVILLLLNFEITFFLILEMYNKCWTDAVQPIDWQIAKIVAIFKQKAPPNYRPIIDQLRYSKLFINSAHFS